MTINPKTLPGDAVVETIADHFAGRAPYLTTASDVQIRGDLSVLRVFVPVPDGVAYDDALRAVNDGDEFQPGKSGTFRRFVHRDDVPDPDADLMEALEEAVPEGGWNGRMALDNLRAAGFDIVKREDQS